MVIEEIDLYKMSVDDLLKYLPEGESASCGAKTWREFAQMLLDKKVKAVDCSKIDKKMAEAIDAVLGIDIRLAESDPMQEKVKEKLIEINSPDPDSPILLTGNSVLTYQILRLILDTAKVKAFIVPIDTNGYTLDNSVAANTVTGMAVMKALSDSGVSSKAQARKAVLPGLARDLKGNIERVTRWNLEVGPVSGFELPLHLLASR